MTGSNDVAWEPEPLPDVLTEQLRSHGFLPSDGAEVARQIGEAVGPAASASLFVDLGACNFLDGDIDGAIATWRRAVSSGQVAPGARALLNLGLLYEHLHLHDRAISVLRSAVERQAEPFATEASIAEARCHCAKGNNTSGLATLARLTENLMVNQPRSGLLGLALLQLGDVARSAGRPDRAERAWRAAANSHLLEVENAANEKLIALLVDLGRDDEARQVIDESTTSRSTLTSSQRLHRAELLIELGRGEHAIELLATVQGDQLDTSERFRLADVLLSQGLVNESIDHLESLTELPLVDHRMRARYALAEVYRLHGMKVEAEEMYQSVIDGEHRYWSPKAGLQLGDLHEQRDDIEGAVGLWVRAASSPVQEVREDAEARLTDRVSTSLATARADDADGEADQADHDVDPDKVVDDWLFGSVTFADDGVETDADRTGAGAGAGADTDAGTDSPVDPLDAADDRADDPADAADDGAPVVTATTFADEIQATVDGSDEDPSRASDDAADRDGPADESTASASNAKDATDKTDDDSVGDQADDAHAESPDAALAPSATDASAKHADAAESGSDGSGESHSGAVESANDEASGQASTAGINIPSADDVDSGGDDAEGDDTATAENRANGQADSVVDSRSTAEVVPGSGIVAPVEPPAQPAQPVFAPPPVTSPPTVIPLRVASLSEELLPPPSVEVGSSPVPSEPFIVALGAADEPFDPSTASDPFADLAPADAGQIAGAMSDGPVNPYAELSPANLVAASRPFQDEPVPGSEAPSPVSTDQLRFDAGSTNESAPSAVSNTAPVVVSGSISGVVDDNAALADPIPGQTRLPIDVPGSRPFNEDPPRDELRWKADRPSARNDQAGDNDPSSDESQGFFSRQVDD